MIQAVLLDLDDTLLNTQTDEFVWRYLQALNTDTLQYFPTLPSDISETIIHTIQAANHAVEPFELNNTTIVNYLAQQLNISVEQWQAFYQQFITRSYPQLRSITTPIPTARTLISELFAHSLQVVIATNPIFTAEAIRQRMEWAGIADFRFALVTHSENMHFTKPLPYYYAEILARLGIQPHQALMIGDNPTHDMQGARQAGLNTFWVETSHKPWPTEWTWQPNGHGNLDSLLQQIQQGWLNTLQPVPCRPEQITPRLLANIAALHSELWLTSTTYYSAPAADGGWSVEQHLLHLHDAERTIYRPRLAQIINHEMPALNVLPTTLEILEPATSASWQVLLADFYAERQQTMALLQAVQPEDWEQPVQLSDNIIMTLLEAALALAQHDQDHINQIRQLLGSDKV